MVFAAEDWPDVSAAALGIWLEARERDRQARVATTEPITATIEIGGEPVAFAGHRSGAAWSLAARIGPARVAVAGRDPAPVPRRLRRILDPLDELGEP